MYQVRQAGRQRGGFTLLEILVVVSIIVILVGIMVVVGSKIRQDAQIKNTKATLQVLTAALEEYKNARGGGGEFSYPIPPVTNRLYDPPWDPRAGTGGVVPAVRRSLRGYDQVEAHPDVGEGAHNGFKWDDIDSDSVEYMRYALSSVEVLYAVLGTVPDCKAILNRLPESAVRNDDNDLAVVGGNPVALREINDAWGHPFLYQYNPDGGNFPVIVSAGPDGLFSTADDIRSDEL